MTSGWPPREPARRSAGHCPYEAALPRVTCCPLSARYLSLADSSFLFLSRPLLFHLPIFSSPLLSLAPVLRSFRQCRLPRPRRAESTPSHHPCPGHMTSSFGGLPNDGPTSESPQCVSCSGRLEGLLSVVHQRGNYLPKLGLELDFLPPQISPDRPGRSTPFH